MRQSGILMPIFSLPSPWGIGTLGEQARQFIDFLAEAGQQYWQLLPVSPTGYGDSPYQSFSSFAGNPYFIDLDALAEEGLLHRDEYAGLDWGSNPCRVDYYKIYLSRFKVLDRAARRVPEKWGEDFDRFCRENSFWLEDYALFTAVKNKLDGIPWWDWPEPLRRRDPDALDQARKDLSYELAREKAIQFLFYRQWQSMREYAARKGISLIGDIPIYTAPDSSDVWTSPELFLLDDDLRPYLVAGCPPDGYSPDGQLWGNPLYNWEVHKETGYTWWISRIQHQFSLYDSLRIDHFRGFDTFYAIPAKDTTARSGSWMPGPGIEFFNAVTDALGPRNIIAEDLGFLTDSVKKLLADSGFPGMKVLQFAFDSREDSDYLPHNYTKNCVAYTGTHDNNTVRGWFESAPLEDVNKAREYLRCGKDPQDEVWSMLTALWASVADLAIACTQDLLCLGDEARINIPGTLSGNWQWRLSPDEDLMPFAARLRRLSEVYGRK